MQSGKKLRRLWTLAITGTVVAACGGGEGDEADANASPTDTLPTSAAPTVPITTDTGAAAVTPAPGATTPAPGTPPAATPATGTPPAAGGAPKATPPAAAAGGNAQAGQTIFAGMGLCFTCHGPGGVGTALGPNLTDNTWLNLQPNPSVQDIAQLVRTGVATPKQHPAPMPAMGGAQLNETQIRDVATYVKSLSGG